MEQDKIKIDNSNDEIYINGVKISRNCVYKLELCSDDITQVHVTFKSPELEVSGNDNELKKNWALQKKRVASNRLL